MKFPDISSLDLAYETGFHVGDGSLGWYQPHHYRYALSGNKGTESDFYKDVLVPLLANLYGLVPSISAYRNSIYATIYSKELLRFKSEVVGLPVGRKDSLERLPLAIVNQGRSNRAKMVSGLYDADASLKIRKTRSALYPRISFAQKTRGIVSHVKEILFEDFEITSTMYRNDYDDKRTSKIETRWFLDINGYPNLRRYSELVGSRHPVVRRMIRFFLNCDLF